MLQLARIVSLGRIKELRKSWRRQARFRELKCGTHKKVVQDYSFGSKEHLQNRSGGMKERERGDSPYVVARPTCPIDCNYVRDLPHSFLTRSPGKERERPLFFLPVTLLIRQPPTFLLRRPGGSSRSHSVLFLRAVKVRKINVSQL